MKDKLTTHCMLCGIETTHILLSHEDEIETVRQEKVAVTEDNIEQLKKEWGNLESIEVGDTLSREPLTCECGEQITQEQNKLYQGYCDDSCGAKFNK